MVQDEKGLESKCVCPQCFSSCSACMGTAGEPLDLESLRVIAILRDSSEEMISDSFYDDFGRSD